jgi:membrane protein implicated in regulation of membrane protease activity
MIIDFLTDYAWIIWVGLILIFVIIEVMSLEFTFLMLAIGSIGGLVAGLIGLDWWVQIVVAGLLALALLLLAKPPLLRALHRGGDPALTLVDALLGSTGTVVSDFDAQQGHVKLSNGETWTARLSPVTEQRDLTMGERVIVTAIDGATAIVVPAERNEQ